MPLSERGFDEVVEGFDDPASKPLLDLFLTFSIKNMSLIILGDSMNSQYLAAMQEELRREAGISILIDDPLDKRWYFTRLGMFKMKLRYKLKLKLKSLLIFVLGDVNMSHKNLKNLRALKVFGDLILKF